MAFCSSELAANGVDAGVIECRQVRRRLKVTQAEFAAMAGVSVRSLIRYELARSDVKPATVAKIRAVVERWTLKPPVLERKVERRGGWNRRSRVSAV
jgi:transcriptional regulator with XRE-family HTH domain